MGWNAPGGWKQENGWYMPAPVVVTGLILDNLSSAVQAAYSFRKLRTAYAGAAVQVRRSSDNLTSDIGFVGNLFDTASYNAWVGGGNGFVRTWYDQSGNGRDAAQTLTNANQPQISLTAINSIPGCTFVPGNPTNLLTSAFAQTASYTASAIVQSNTSSGVQILLNADDGSSIRIAQYLRYNVTALEVVAFDTVPNAYVATQSVTPTNANVISGIRDGVGQTVRNWVNGTASSSVGTSNTAKSGTLGLNIGVFADLTGNPFSGNVSEIILLGAASTSDRSAIETSERSYAGI